ncbi:MAG: hypothetical protein AB7G10_24035 [Reyranellaceae bacterium]
MMKPVSAVLIAALVCVVGGPSFGQTSQQWAVGTWRGEIYPDPRESRVLFVEIVNGNGMCIWKGFSADMPPQRPCKITDTSVEFSPSDGVQVVLKRSGNTLEGTLTRGRLIKLTKL